MIAVPLLAVIGYAVLVVLLFKAMERIEASAPLTEGRQEDRRAESAGIAFSCAFVLVAIVCMAVVP